MVLASGARVTAPPRPALVGDAPGAAGPRTASSSQRLEGEQHAAGQQRRDDREVRVLGGRREQGDRPVLDRGEQRVLLGLAEPVHLVDEEHGRRAAGAAGAGPSSITARTSLTPAVSADIATKRRSVAPATRWAMVVLPLPGGPQRITDVAPRRPRPAGAAARPGRAGGPARPARRAPRPHPDRQRRGGVTAVGQRALTADRGARVPRPAASAARAGANSACSPRPDTLMWAGRRTPTRQGRLEPAPDHAVRGDPRARQPATPLLPPPSHVAGTWLVLTVGLLLVGTQAFGDSASTTPAAASSGSRASTARRGLAVRRPDRRGDRRRHPDAQGCARR